MYLYKAVKEKTNALSSVFDYDCSRINSECFDYNDQYGITITNLLYLSTTHITHGDHKKRKDCWISFTSDFDTALDYVKRDGYTGVAIIKLPDDFLFGKIYDQVLRETGLLIGKYHDKITFDNNNGIIMGLDLSREADYFYVMASLLLRNFVKEYEIGRINYLTSYDLIKSSPIFNNFRYKNYSRDNKEILLLGSSIQVYDYIPKEKFVEYNNNNFIYSNENENINHSENSLIFDDLLLENENNIEIKFHPNNFKYKFSDIDRQQIDNYEEYKKYAYSQIEYKFSDLIDLKVIKNIYIYIFLKAICTDFILNQNIEVNIKYLLKDENFKRFLTKFSLDKLLENYRDFISTIYKFNEQKMKRELIPPEFAKSYLLSYYEVCAYNYYNQTRDYQYIKK